MRLKNSLLQPIDQFEILLKKPGTQNDNISIKSEKTH